MSKNNMDEAIEHAKKTKQLFNRGDIEGAYAHYMLDPMGGGNPEFNNTQKDQFVLGMQRMSGGPKAAIYLAPNERQAWCESGADDTAIEMIADAGGFNAIRVNGRKLSSYQDLLGVVMNARIAGICNELGKLGWEKNPDGILSKVVDDISFQAKLVRSYINAGKNVVGFEFDVIDVSQVVWSHNVVDNNMSLSMAAMAKAIDGVAVAKALGGESSLGKAEKIDLPEVGCVLGAPYPDWPDNLTTFPERKIYQLGVAHGKAVQKHQDGQNVEQLMTVLVQAIESSGFSVSGPTDMRAAEHGEPAWVCNARTSIAEYGNDIGCRGDVIKPLKEFELGVSDSYDQSYSEAKEIACARDGFFLARGKEANRFEGRVTGITSHHVVQHIGRLCAIHHKPNLDRIPEKNEVLSINYDGAGRGVVTVNKAIEKTGNER